MYLKHIVHGTQFDVFSFVLRGSGLKMGVEAGRSLPVTKLFTYLKTSYLIESR
jgi:hypothetical protein